MPPIIDVEAIPYALIPAAAGVVSVMLALYAYTHRREARSAVALAIFVSSVALWTLTYTAEILTPSLRGKLFWTSLQYIGISTTPVLWLVFVLAYSGLSHHLTLRNLILLHVVPVIVMLSVWTNGLHHLHYLDVSMATENVPFRRMVLDYGPTFWLVFGYSYLMMVLSTVVLVRVALRGQALYRRQAVLLIATGLFPWVGNLLTFISRQTRWYLLGGLNLTPLGFALSGGLLAWTLFELRVLDLAPAARERVFDSMGDAVLVIDTACQIVDANPRAVEVLGMPLTQLTDSTVDAVMPAAPFLPAAEAVAQSGPFEWAQPGGGEFQTFNVRLSPLRSRGGSLLGHVITLHDISDRLAHEAALRESEERYRTLLDAPFEAIAVHRDGVIIDVNPSFETMFGVPREQIVGKDATQMVADDSRGRLLRHIEEGLEGPYEVTITPVGRDPFPAEIRAKSILYRGERVRVAAIRNLSERKRMEAAERAQRALAEVLRDTAAALNSTLDLDRVLDRILENAHRLVPHKAATVMLIRDGHAYNARARGYGEAIYQQILAMEVSIAGVHYLRHMLETGQPVIVNDVVADPHWVDTGIAPWIRSYMGVPIVQDGEMIGFINLDSDRVDHFEVDHSETMQIFANQAATAIHNARLYGESQRRNEQLALLNQITRIGTAVIDLDELLQTLADSAAEIVGGDGCYITLWDENRQMALPGAANGPLRDTYQNITPPSGEQSFTDTLHKAERPIVIKDVFESPHISAEIARKFPAKSMLGLPLIADGRFLGALLLAFNTPHTFTDEDIVWASQAAELVALAIAKAQTYAELETRNAELDAFSHTVAHDLKAPLGGVIGYMALIREVLQEEDHSTDLIDMVERALRSARKVGQIVDGLLLLAHLRSAEGMKDVVLPNALVAEALERYDIEIADRGIDIKVQPELPVVLGNGPWLEEVFANLLSNAIKYIGGSNPDPRIIVRGKRFPAEKGEPPRARIEIVDNGLGIPATQLDRLFEAFERYHTDHARGLGLGLNIVKRVIDKLGGKLGVESTEGEGSTFWFELEAPTDEALTVINPHHYT